MTRLHNFSAGPSTLPLCVLEEVQAELAEYRDCGMSLVEMSHRGREYTEVHDEATSTLRSLTKAPDEFEILLLQGGATLQFAMVPMNLVGTDERAGFVHTGHWAGRALADAEVCASTYVAWDGGNEGYVRTPTAGELVIEPASAYLHITSNETIDGIQYRRFPDVEVPLVGDMSSDYLSRPIDFGPFDLIYGGVQKNLAPAGLAIVFVRRSVIESAGKGLPSYLRYETHASANSMFNTPPMFAIYVMGKVLLWIENQGGLDELDRLANARADLIYGQVDVDDFYVGPVHREYRSLMNIVFTIANGELEPRFLAEAADADLVNLKGHRSIGGIRASVYNAMPLTGAAALAEFMADFRGRYG